MTKTNHSTCNPRILVRGITLVLLLGLVSSSATTSVAHQPPSPNQLATDPLMGKEEISLDELLDALEDPERREMVIPLHYHGAAKHWTEQQRLKFLSSALRNSSLAVQQYATLELDRVGQLGPAIRGLLQEWSKEDSPHLAQSLNILRNPEDESSFDPDQIDLLLAQLSSDLPSKRIAAEEQLLGWGPQVIPVLLERLDDEREPIRIGAAVQLRRLLNYRRTNTKSISPPDAHAPKVQGKALGTGKGDTTRIRKLDDQMVDTVRVYFGTNRQIAQSPDPRWKLYGLPVLVISGCGVVWMGARRVLRRERPKHGCVMVAGLLVLVGLLGWSLSVWNTAFQQATSKHQGPQFGPRRSTGGTIYYGHCDVSLPRTHSIGEVERPLIGPEDEGKHVLLRRTTIRSKDEFYALLKSQLASRNVDARDCFVFVHGYNTSFAQAARRTAQIHHDLRFQGVPIFFSWPSRGSIRHYPSDRNEVLYSQEHLKDFLVGVAEKTTADRVHVIAHSMGGEAVCRAIAEIDQDGKLFDQIILAAPDIDADIFVEQLVPRLKAKSRRTTLYCSRSDWALHASYAFNDSPRIGDSSRILVVREEIDTVDASDVETDVLGHSYYGDGLTLLNDVRLLLEENLPPASRKLRRRVSENRLSYWMFP